MPGISCPAPECLQERIEQRVQQRNDFPTSKTGKQPEVAAMLITVWIPVAVIKVTQGASTGMSNS